MAMENYSPSHPTDEVDLDNSPDIKIINESKIVPPIEITKEKKSRSKSIENPRKSKVRSRSSSRKRRSNSRSRNRRSRSRNKADRSFNSSRNTDKRSRSKDRRSRSKDRRSRSKDRRSRSKDYKARGKDRRSRSRDRRSKSKERRSRTKDKRSRSKDRRSRSKDSKRYQSRTKDSRTNNDRKEENIFSKLTDLSTAPIEPPVKSKWAYDSDEDNSSTKPEIKSNFEPASRNEETRNFPNRNENTRNFPNRSEFNNRRGNLDQSRGFQRNKEWEPRNSRSNFPPRNNQSFNRNNSSFANDDEDIPVNSPPKSNWAQNKKSEETDELGTWGKVEELNSPKEDTSFPIDSKKKGFAADSDEEFGGWNNEKKNLNQMLTKANIESQSGINYDSIESSSNNKFAENSDEEFGAWGSEQKSAKAPQDPPQNQRENRQDTYQGWTQNKSVVPSTDNFAADSDDEYGSWGKDRQAAKASASNDNRMDFQGSQSNGSFSHNQRPNFNRNNNNNDNARFQGRRGNNNSFNRFQRPNESDSRFNNNSNPNYSNNPPSNFTASSQNFSNFTGNFNNPTSNLANANPDMMAQMNMQLPPYNFNPSQRPPQWISPMNNMQFPPMCNGQMPFNALPPLMPPQMQFTQQMNPQQQQQQQVPPMSMSMPANLMQQSMSYIPPPPPSTTQPGPMSGSIFQPAAPMPQMSSNNNNDNLLEKIMTNVGLSSKNIRMQQSDMYKPQPPQHNKTSVSDSLHNIIKSAASTVLSRLVENSHKTTNAAGNISDSMSMSPPSPTSSPPSTRQHNPNVNPAKSDMSDFVLPPLPIYADIMKQPSSTNISLPNILGSSTHSNSTGNNNNAGNSQSAEISEEKRNRSDFQSKGDWQERIALEVKNFLRPAYMSKKISKSDYKEIMKRCVTKISRSGVTEINTEKIEKFVLSYVDKYQKFRRGKQHGVVSSSEHELVM